MKKLNKLSLSLVVGSLLFTQSYALPSGGKFTHGTSGSISVSGGTMNISGSKTNSVIQWGGGFNIANGETVNFKGNGYNYLNIVYGSKSSHIDGTLEGGTNNIFLINPNGIVVGKDGSINANRVFLSASSIGDKEMKEFAKDGKISAFEGNPLTTASPVIKSNAGNVINLGTITAGERVVMVGNQVSNMKYGSTDYGKFIFTNKKEQSNTVYLDVYSNDIFVIRGPASNTIKKEDSIMLSIRPNKGSTGPGGDPTDTIGYKETSDLVAKDNISNEVLNSIFNDLKFNSSVDISDLSKFYKDGKILTADELTSINQSMDFITALYGQTQDSNNATFANALKEVLGNSYGNLGKANQAIIKTKEILSQIPKITEQQKNIQKAYDQAVDAYNEAVKKYNAALSGVTGSNASETITALKTVLDKAYNDLKNAEANLESTTASNNSSLKSSNETLASVSIDGYKLTVNGEYLADYKTVNKPNDNNSGSNNGNDGTDSGDINNGNNNGSNNNPNDTIGQQEPDIATALLMQTTDEDPNINEDDKQASIDEASTQESGNACIVSDNFKAGNPCSR
ncbi:filamentous hemagglutinin N-terminal domain-containing protein [Campylobacter jejuni]|uniref:Filamentous hemagglutinin N-terminal domain-containing protein n=3 Tax=Campylobacter jejuni TaxID=197 RepID=A0A5T0EW98_CAMJU|nr:filamentous hemagglutinin N-terminal domain-containing protein [Campylobacter jejuni]EAH4598494.1 filamentous hemagglutinin N-terminal domain-containing protein [Campylobacter jejuni]EAH4823959.1 filamentous hemagglutinin N-terminal domain-containing protein [Campylobacter jejuni]EAH7697291.1 filamentous hemagglutinin N-terminal domain-containing protein [Campylobacter jejuni]EAH8652729.1 filamentous hemagglutinin N-terminal domain-containing protein [Campylobacter jejuni]EAI1977385.1 filam